LLEPDAEAVGTKGVDRLSDSCRIVCPDIDSDTQDRQASMRLQWSDEGSSDEDSGIGNDIGNDRKEVKQKEATSIAESTKYRQYLKPRKFDGSSASETFLAQFSNCAAFNQWNEEEQLAFLKGALEKEAAQVL